MAVMNQQFRIDEDRQLRSPDLPMTTQAAEGLPRRRWTVAEIEELTRIGFFAEDDRFELIGGEIVPMNAKGIRHEVLKAALNYFWIRKTPDEYRLIPETTFRMSEDTFVEPDFVFYRRVDGLANLRPETALLAVEIANSSIAYDLGRKARIYATFGIREVWVIDAVRRICHVHSRPALDGYEDIRTVPDNVPLALPFAPQVAIALSKLEPE